MLTSCYLLQKYAAYGETVSDDNQLLAYGAALYYDASPLQENFALLHRINGKITLH